MEGGPNFGVHPPNQKPVGTALRDSSLFPRTQLYFNNSNINNDNINRIIIHFGPVFSLKYFDKRSFITIE